MTRRAFALVALVLAAAASGAAQAPPPPPPPVATPRRLTPERESLRAAERRLRETPRGTPAFDSARTRRDSLRRTVVAAQRARGDSLRAERRRVADSLSSAAPPRRDPTRGNPPFYGYTWAFYASVFFGAGCLWLFVWKRLAATGRPLSRVGTFLTLLLGGLLGAAAFVPLFMLNGLLSVGFSPAPPALLLLVSVAATLWVVGAIAQLGRRRTGRGLGGS